MTTDNNMTKSDDLPSSSSGNSIDFSTHRVFFKKSEKVQFVGEGKFTMQDGIQFLTVQIDKGFLTVKANFTSASVGEYSGVICQSYFYEISSLSSVVIAIAFAKSKEGLLMQKDKINYFIADGDRLLMIDTIKGTAILTIDTYEKINITNIVFSDALINKLRIIEGIDAIMSHLNTTTFGEDVLFKAGDVIYAPLFTIEPITIEGIFTSYNHLSISYNNGKGETIEICVDKRGIIKDFGTNKVIFHATAKNKQMIESLHGFKLAETKKLLTGSELCVKLLSSGGVFCLTSYVSDKEALNSEPDIELIMGVDGSGFCDINGSYYQYAVPIDTDGKALSKEY